VNSEGLEEVITDGDVDGTSVLIILGDIVVPPERKLI
jgi:hypothetical protein